MKMTLATPKDFGLFPHVPGEAFTLAMEVENEQVAFALFYQNEQRVTLADLFVVPDYNGKGYGRAFLAELAKTATQQTNGKLSWVTSDFEGAMGTLLPFTDERASSVA